MTVMADEPLRPSHSPCVMWGLYRWQWQQSHHHLPRHAVQPLRLGAAGPEDVRRVQPGQKRCAEHARVLRPVANIACAASKSTNPCCRDMFKYYDKPGCSDNWAGAFDQFVFKVSGCPAVFRSK